MKTINTPRPTSLSVLVDQEFVTIPYSAATLRLNECEPATARRNTLPFSHIGCGKIRRMFNRHTVAYRR